MNSVKQPCSSGVLTAQWIECLSGVQEVMSTSIPVGNSDLFFVSHSYHVEQVTFHRIIFVMHKNTEYADLCKASWLCTI